MAPPTDPNVTFVTPFVVHGDLVYVLTENTQGTGDQAKGMVVKYVQKKWKRLMLPFVGLVAIDAVKGPERDVPLKLTVIGVDGDVYTSSDAGNLHTKIDPSPSGPDGRGWIRSMRRVGDGLYAVGMSRQAYVCGTGDTWQHIDADILAGPEAGVGLNDIDGFSGRELYAAGLKGEIWRYDGSRWHAIESPTNVQLNAVRRRGEEIYIVGAAGVLLRGRGDVFRVAATEEDESNLYAIEAFASKLFVASLTNVYEVDDGALTKVDMRLGEITAGSLHGGDGALWSVGGKHLIATADGMNWTQLFV